VTASNGNLEAVRDVAEAEADREAVRADLEIPELVLQHDGHLGGVARAQAVVDHHGGMIGAKGDVEVMAPGHPAPGDHLERVAHHGAERSLHEPAVIEGLIGHGQLRC
jgi:hypothetical protein